MAVQKESKEIKQEKWRSYASPRPTYSPSELDIALHDCYALRMNRTKVPKEIPSDFIA